MAVSVLDERNLCPVAAQMGVMAARGEKFLSSKTETAMTAVTGLHSNHCLVYEFHGGVWNGT
jgi:hypothetical protein